MISHLASAFFVLSVLPAVPTKSIVYKTSIVDSTGVIGSPIVQTLDKTTASIKTTIKGREFELKFTPTLMNSGQIEQHIHASITAVSHSKQKGTTYRSSSSRNTDIAMRTAQGQSILITFGPSKVENRILKDREKVSAKEGEVLIRILSSVAKGT